VSFGSDGSKLHISCHNVDYRQTIQIFNVSSIDFSHKKPLRLEKFNVHTLHLDILRIVHDF